MEMLHFTNDGQRIVQTNYWDIEHAKRGLVFLSWNAGAGRLLVPDGLKSSLLREIRSAKFVIVSRGPWLEHGQQDALEILFEDNSDSPYAIQLLASQTDRLLPEHNQGGGFDVVIWTRDGEQNRFTGKYRQVSTIPCLEPWSVQ
jgi:hypothetical protein